MLEGKKGKIGGVLVLLSGLIQGLGELGVNIPVVGEAVTTIFALGAGLGIWGIRAKQSRDNPERRHGDRPHRPTR